jgi:hypothetical protein
MPLAAQVDYPAGTGAIFLPIARCRSMWPPHRKLEAHSLRSTNQAWHGTSTAPLAPVAHEPKTEKRINELGSQAMKKSLAVVLSAAIAVTGCATASKDIGATYVSPMQYQQYDCDQLGAEGGRIQARVNQSGGRLDEASSNDKVITTVGVILFWPILFALGGTKQQEADYARLKGEYDAVQQTAVLKKCPRVVPPVQPIQAAPVPAKEAQSM